MKSIVLFSILFGLGFCFIAPVRGMISEDAEKPTVTVICYLNGDNDLSEEVLYALDRIETAGSSESVNVIALVDGNPKWLGQYAISWAHTRMLKVEFDSQIGVINATVLEDWGEANLADPEILERFVRTAIDLYPADRYFFYTFAHSQGIIDTRTFSIQKPTKTVSISNDDTSRQKMDLKQFHDALRSGLAGRRFDLMAMFSCLANMVEIGYALSDLTHYFVASQDEIRLVNEPSGRFQICGFSFETAIDALNNNPDMNATDIGRMLVDSHVDNYLQEKAVSFHSPKIATNQLSAGMALVECKALPLLVDHLDGLARLMIKHAEDPMVVNAVDTALNSTHRFASFLDLEYYDLYHFVQNLRDNLRQAEIIQACNAVLSSVQNRVLRYARHTMDRDVKGISIYLSHPLVPDNIYNAHQFMYAKSQFSHDTLWDEMIDCFRNRLQ